MSCNCSATLITDTEQAKRASLKTPANHRSSFDGPLGLFCVSYECSAGVK